jgi:YgiT-type zinc finger domain-containing protein
MTVTICPNCHIGRLHHRQITYVQWYGEELLVVNKMPAMVCDVCGEGIYDDKAVEHLHQLLWANLDKVPSPRSHHLT